VRGFETLILGITTSVFPYTNYKLLYKV